VLARAGQVYARLAQAGVALPSEQHFCLTLAESSETQYQAALAQQRGLTMEVALRVFFTAYAIDVPEALLTQAVNAYCQDTGQAAPLRLGAHTTLADLHARGLQLGVISNTIQPGHFLDAFLERQGLLSFFSARIYSSDMGLAKPHPEIFRAALAALDVTPSEAVHVGDRLLVDTGGAQAVGMRTVLIRVPGRHPEPPSAIAPDAIINELTELPGVLDRLATEAVPAESQVEEL
jgi:HAD superfamily hydrolase (TIGR01509 family)